MLWCFAFGTGAQTAAAQETPAKLEVLLARISFNCAEKPETLGRELAELDASELTALCDMLVEPGTGDDTKARLALHAMTWYVGSEGTDEQRGKFVDVLCKALQADKPAAVKAFLIRQLQLGADRRAVPTLATLLGDEELCEPAAQALLAIGGEQAAEVFVHTLPYATGKNRVTILKAIHQCSHPDAGRYLLKDPSGLLQDTASSDPELRANALAALAASDVPAAAEALLNAMRTDSWWDSLRTDSWRERTQAAQYALELADRLGKRNNKDHAARIYRTLMESCSDPQEIHIRCAALHGLAELLGAEAVGEVVAALTSENPELRAAATNIAATLSGEAATEAYLRELKTASAAARAGILAVLARRGDVAALPAALTALKDADKDVRIAAVKASAALGHEKALGPLVAFLDTDQADERKAAEQALTELPGEQVSAELAAAIRRAPALVRSALLDVLARRGAVSQLDMIFTFATDRSERVRIAAINAVGELADEQAVSKLVPLLRRAKSEAEREALEVALAATACRADSAFKRSAFIIVAIDRDRVRDYCSLLRVLGRIGGTAGVKTVQQAAQDPRPEVREAAIRAFLDWPDATAIDAVLETALKTEDLKHHVLAMRAYARQVGLDTDRRAEETLALFDAGMDAARRAEEKKLLLARLADVKDARAFDKLADYLGDEALRAEAGSAMIGVARGILPAGWAPAREALEKVLEAVDDERVRRHAEDVMKQVVEYEDYVTDWLVTGPYEEQGKDGKAIFNVVFPPELSGAKDVQWKQQAVSEDPEWYWFVDLEQSVGGDNRAAYLRTYVWSPEIQDALLELGSDDGIKVWLNGEVIHVNNVPRGCGRGQDKVTTTLNKGWNELMLKVVDYGGGWAACLRVRAPDGDRLAGLKIDAKAQP
ncbi:MAG: HEAT repeat domain-containing protein [Phycisphaerae bacterium]